MPVATFTATAALNEIKNQRKAMRIINYVKDKESKEAKQKPRS